MVSYVNKCPSLHTAKNAWITQRDGRQAGTHQCIELGGLEALKRLFASLLGHVAMQAACTNSAVAQAGGDVVGIALCVGEHDAAAPKSPAGDEVAHERWTLREVTRQHHVAHRGRSSLCRTVVADQIHRLVVGLEEALAQVLDPLRHRGTEQKRLDACLVALLGLEDCLHILNEAHLQPSRVEQCGLHA
eukprot:351491-Chlamydomonas_euryale.AAC.31